MAKKNFNLAIGLAFAFLAMQTPHLAQAYGDGGQEVTGTTMFPERQREYQPWRNFVSVQNPAVEADGIQSPESRGFFGVFFRND